MTLRRALPDPAPTWMPRLSSTTRYATHAMLEIAEANGQIVPAATIVEHQGLPATFLDQLLARLRRAGLLHSIRGPHGGYLLARPATSISLADIVHAIEGGLDALAPGAPEVFFGASSTGDGRCAVEEAWLCAGAAMHDVMRRTSLAALVRRKSALEHDAQVRPLPTPVCSSGAIRS